MRISALINRLVADASHDPALTAITAALLIIVAALFVLCVLGAYDTTRTWRRRRHTRRLVAREPGIALAVCDDRGHWREATPKPRQFAPGSLGPYPEHLPPPGVADLRTSRAARRRMWTQIQATLADAQKEPS